MGQAENNCRAGGDAGAWRGRRRGGWTESEGVGGVGFREGVGVELAYVRVGMVGGGAVGRGGLRGLGGLDGLGRTERACAGRADAGGWWASWWWRACVGPVFALVGGSASGPATLSSDAEFKVSQGSACNMPGAAPRRIPAAVRASGADSCATVRPTPGAGGARGVAWSTWLRRRAGHLRTIYRGQRLGEVCRSPGVRVRRVFGGVGGAGTDRGAGADSDGGRDPDPGCDPDPRAGTAAGSATGTECGPSVPWAPSPAPCGVVRK